MSLKISTSAIRKQILASPSMEEHGGKCSHFGKKMKKAVRIFEVIDEEESAR